MTKEEINEIFMENEKLIHFCIHTYFSDYTGLTVKRIYTNKVAYIY